MALENLDKVTASMLKETMAIGKDRVAEIDKLSAKYKTLSQKKSIRNKENKLLKILRTLKRPGRYKNIETISILLPRHYNQDYPQVYRSLFSKK